MRGNFVLPFACLSVIACANPSSAMDYSKDLSIYSFNAAERANISSLYQYEQSMAGTIFGMYPTYWRLNKDLANADVGSIVDFVNRYNHSVIAEKLVADFAEEKAKMGDYAPILQVAHLIQNADDSEACAIALGYNHSTHSHKTLDLKERFIDTYRMPDLCRKLADEMIYNPNISAVDREQRLVRMMRIDGRQLSKKYNAENTKSQIIALANSLNLPISLSQLDDIAHSPRVFINQMAMEPYSQLNQYLYIYAISQLAHSSYDNAIYQLESDIAIDDARPQRLIGDMARRYAYRSIATKRMTVNTDNGFNIEAVNWYRLSLGVPFNYEEAERYAQAAIYFGAWQDVQYAILSMTPKKQNERSWRYWLARSYQMTGRLEYQGLYQSLLDDIDYYGLLARDRLGHSLTLNEIGSNQMPQADTKLVMSDPNFARAIFLMDNNASTTHVNREWNWAVRRSNNPDLVLSAAKMAYDRGNYPRAIFAIDNSRAKNSALSHPTPYRNDVVRYSANVGIDPAWVYGIIRQESRFQTAVKSSANAQGLMQIIPSTAKLIARAMGESVGNMNNPATNIRYGAWYLADTANKANDEISVATAGYNAGPNTAKKWRPTHAAISADQYIEAIPYGETRNYVKNVMANATIYGVLLDKYTPISIRMGVVSPSY